MLPARGLGVLRSVRPREQLVRGASMFLATLMFFTTLSYIPRPRPPPSASSRAAGAVACALDPEEPARLSRFVAAGIAFVGVIIVIRPGGGLDPTGTVFGLLTACCFAAQFIATRRVAGDDRSLADLGGAVGTACS